MTHYAIQWGENPCSLCCFNKGDAQGPLSIPCVDPLEADLANMEKTELMEQLVGMAMAAVEAGMCSHGGEWGKYYVRVTDGGEFSP